MKVSARDKEALRHYDTTACTHCSSTGWTTNHVPHAPHTRATGSKNKTALGPTTIPFAPGLWLCPVVSPWGATVAFWGRAPSLRDRQH